MKTYPEELSRLELYDLVWSTPMVVLAKKYNLSDNGLRNICLRMNIPLPKAGHWMKLQFGKEVNVKPLPERYEGDETLSLSLRASGECNGHIQTSPFKRLLAEIKEDARLSIVVPARLSAPDPLVKAAKERLMGADALGSFTHKGVISCRWNELDIRVAKSNVGLALRFMDTLVKLLQARGHGIKFRNECTYAIVKSQELKICFREKLKKVVVNNGHWNNTELHPTGILSFKIDSYYGREWIDGKQPLEDRLAEILAKMEIESDRQTEIQKYHQQQREEWERQKQIERELKERKEKERSDFKDMLAKAERWHKAANLRNYIDEVERRGGQSSEWLHWARAKADWYDPFVEMEDELMEGHN